MKKLQPTDFVICHPQTGGVILIFQLEKWRSHLKLLGESRIDLQTVDQMTFFSGQAKYIDDTFNLNVQFQDESTPGSDIIVMEDTFNWAISDSFFATMFPDMVQQWKITLNEKRRSDVERWCFCFWEQRGEICRDPNCPHENILEQQFRGLMDSLE
eukprot:TRINITY_DN16299_c0_g1_i1.p1 TRINITY_DN16299_c0_g1~~TRINITY_DN16299_c0_g1_i1.p1  ORF type:complete len:171 (-),score=30.17 TRINITY_DN16299_c0_g1_i1:53-520(-)